LCPKCLDTIRDGSSGGESDFQIPGVSQEFGQGHDLSHNQDGGTALKVEESFSVGGKREGQKGSVRGGTLSHNSKSWVGGGRKTHRPMLCEKKIVKSKLLPRRLKKPGKPSPQSQKERPGLPSLSMREGGKNLPNEKYQINGKFLREAV